MWTSKTQPPGIPTPEQLSDLNPVVAVLLLVVVGLFVVGFFFGGAIRDRLGRPSPPDQPRPTDFVPTAPPGQVATAVVDRAAEAETQFRQYLLDRIDELEREIGELREENRRLREDVERYRYPPPGWRP